MLGVVYLRTILKSGPVDEEVSHRRIERERLWRTEPFRGDIEWWQQPLPIGKNSWGAICLGEASGPFIPSLPAFVRGLAAAGRRFIAEGTEGNQLALV